MAKKKTSAQTILAWILMAMLLAGLGGFGIDSFFTQQVTSIGSVGNREISAQSYSRALQSEMAALEQQARQPISFTMAQAMGIDQQVRAQLITQAALENEAERVGLSVGDATVARTIRSYDAFSGPTGAFDMDTYRFQLQNAGLSIAEFEDEVRRDAARGLLQSATAAGIETPENLRAALVEYYATRHAFDLFTLGEADLPAPVADPDAATIEAYYTDHIDRFTAPESRAITFAWITPEMILDTIELDEARIRALYDERIAEFVQPERRLVERLVFESDAAAQEAMDRLTAGETDFDALVAERGLTLEDADMGDVAENDLGAAGAAVFALEEPGAVAGPLPSTFGPALYRMNAILNAQETPYEEAREGLRDELAAEAARRAIADQQESFDDLLAGGATLEELADETAMQLGTIDWTTESNEGIAAYTEFAQAAATLSASDFPELASLSDGGLFALRLDGVTPPTPRPLEEVREAAAAGARAEAVAAALLRYGQSLTADLAAQGTEAFAEAQGISAESYEGVTRLDTLDQIPAPMLESLMSAEAGTPVLNVVDGQALIALTGETLPADPGDAQTARLTQVIDEQIGAALAQDVYAYFARALQAESGISLNQPAIEAVNASFQ